jgi:hypothetical protein
MKFAENHFGRLGCGNPSPRTPPPQIAVLRQKRGGNELRNCRHFRFYRVADRESLLGGGELANNNWPEHYHFCTSSRGKDGCG